MDTPITEWTIAKAGIALRQGTITSRELTEALLDRIAALQPQLNCYISVEGERALEMADAADTEIAAGRWRGPLHGVPMAHKDAFDREGHVTTVGTRLFNEPAAVTSTAIQGLDDAGAVNLGALHMDELAAHGYGQNRNFGICLNPWNADHVIGGSSGGSGVAVVSRMALGALGGDTGGSVRIPAAMCGVTGLKPTLGRISLHGAARRSWSADCPGPLAQTAEDCGLMMQAVAGFDPADPITRDVAVPDYTADLTPDLQGFHIGIGVGPPFDDIHADVAPLHADAIAVFRDLGATVTEIEVPGAALANDLQQTLIKPEITMMMRDLLQRTSDISPEVLGTQDEGNMVPATRYLEAKALRGPVLEEHVHGVYGKVDVLFTAGLSGPVPTVEEMSSSDVAAISARYRNDLRIIRFINYLGTPAMSVPCGFTPDGLPNSFQLHGPPFAEKRLIEVAHAYQLATNWHTRIPLL
ncbi:MAG: Asp-tRNA(Asn)/Glu-tRNA(Gln) amidotransferase GatCAB subunit A [Alphaproteobacteria bacterium]|nr:Asp-tRNA(Asn)/Glu-tRNA(Gln) amidotransferase GatCAB subunit A [Alphaproteobacteria bacterium]